MTLSKSSELTATSTSFNQESESLGSSVTCTWEASISEKGVVALAVRK